MRALPVSCESGPGGVRNEPLLKRSPSDRVLALRIKIVTFSLDFQVFVFRPTLETENLKKTHISCCSLLCYYYELIYSPHCQKFRYCSGTESETHFYQLEFGTYNKVEKTFLRFRLFLRIS